MEAILFCGIQATGKSTFYIERFFKTHVRISMDLLKTRYRENLFMDACVKTQQAFVIDNTNPTKAEREKYIQVAKQYNYKIIGYYFSSNLTEALARNASRLGKDYIPEVGVKGTYKKLQLPSREEGFDALYFVELTANGFEIKEWTDEI